MPMDFNLPGNFSGIGWGQQIGGGANIGGTQGPTGTAVFNDTIQGFEQLYQNYGSYDFLPSNPILPTVNPNNDPSGFHTFVQNAQNFSFSLPSFGQQPGPQNTYDETVAVQLSSLTDAQLAAIAPGVPRDQAIAQIQFAMSHPEANVPANIRDIANSIAANATTTADQQWGVTDFKPDLGTGLYDETVLLSNYAMFQAKVAASGLPIQQQNQLIFAFNHPGAAGSLPPNLQAIFNQYESGINSQLQSLYGFPSGWQLGNYSQSADKAMNLEYDSNFESAVNAKIADGEITAQQGAELVAMHYDPNAQVPDRAALEDTFNQINGQVLGQLQQQWGFPDGWTPTPNANVFNQILDAGFSHQFNVNLQSYSPPLTAEQQALLRAALGDPALASSLSPELQAALNNIKSMSISEIQQLFGLPVAWEPTPGPVSDPGLQSWGAMIAQNALDQGKEIVGNAINAINGMPDGPTKMDLLDFMKIVSMALAKLQQDIFALDVQDANTQAMLNKIQNDAQLSKIAYQKKKLEEVKKKEAKMKSLGPLMGCMKWLLVIILAAIPGGQLLLAAAFTALMVQNKGDLGKTLANPDVMQGMMDAMSAIGGKGLEATFGVLMMLTPIGMTDLMFGNGTMLQDTLTAMGVPSNIAGYITMGVSIVAQIAMEVLMEIFTAGAATELVVGMVMMKVAQATLRVVSKVAEVAVQAIEMLVKKIAVISQAIADAIAKLIPLLTKLIQKCESLIARLGAAMKEAEPLLNQLKNAKEGLEANKADLAAAKEGLAAAREAGDTAMADMYENLITKLAKEIEAGEAKVEEILKQLKTISKLLTKIMTPKDAILNGMSIIKEGIDLIQAGITINNDVLNAQVAMLKAELDAYMAVIDQFMKTIDQVIQNVLDDLANLGKWIENVGQQEQSFWQGASQVMTGIAAA